MRRLAVLVAIVAGASAIAGCGGGGGGETGPAASGGATLDTISSCLHVAPMASPYGQELDAHVAGQGVEVWYTSSEAAAKALLATGQQISTSIGYDPALNGRAGRSVWTWDVVPSASQKAALAECLGPAS